MVASKQITDRFIIALKEVSVNNTLKEIAIKSKTSESYLSQIKKKSRKIPATLIANFCIHFGYSPTWILTGQGNKKLITLRTTEDKLICQNEQLIETIRDLLRALIELKPVHTPAIKELIKQSEKRGQ